MNSGEQSTQQKRGRHLNRKDSHVQGSQRYSLHPLIDELEGRSTFRGENTDSVGEKNKGQTQELRMISVRINNIWTLQNVKIEKIGLVEIEILILLLLYVFFIMFLLLLLIPSAP